MSENSFIEISCEEARRLAFNVIQRIDTSRSEFIDQFIEKEMNRLNNNFFHKLFRRKPVTREEVLSLEREDIWSPINENWFTFGRQHDLALKVLAASRVGKTMFLSLDDYSSIS